MLIFRPLRFLPSEVKSPHSLIPQLISMSASFKNIKEWRKCIKTLETRRTPKPAQVFLQPSIRLHQLLCCSGHLRLVAHKRNPNLIWFWGIVIKLFLEKSPNSFLSPDSLCPPENFGQRSALASHHHWGLWGFWGLCRWLTCCRANPCDVQLLN